MTVRIETRPGVSRIGRLAGPLSNKTLRRALDAAPFHPRMLGGFWLSDYAGAVIRPPRGTRIQRVAFDGFLAEMTAGPGVTPSDRVVLYFHGGAFVGGGVRSHRRLVARLSSASGAPVFSVAYRQLPKARLHQSIEDCLEAYRQLLARYSPEKIVIAGDSAGGYLSIATTLRAMDQGLPAPAGIAALSPWLDLMCVHSSQHPNAVVDAYLPWRKLSAFAALLPTESHPVADLNDADLSKLPPVFMQVGSTELVRCDAEMMAESLGKAGVPCHLQIWEGQVHDFQILADVIPEAREAINEIGTFVRARTLTSKDAVA